MSRIASIGTRASALAERLIPEPFVIAIVLSAITVFWGMIASDRTGVELVTAFSTGMLDTALLAFAFKMALILVTGYALAEAPSVKRLLSAVSNIPKTGASAAALVCAFSMALGLFNWGLGLVAGAFLAREAGASLHRRQVPFNYALIGAAGYMGLLVWHGGLSGSAPLKVAKTGPFGEAIPVTETIFSNLNMIVTLLLIGVLPLLFRNLGRQTEGPTAGSETFSSLFPLKEDQPATTDARQTGLLSRVENSRFVTACLVLPISITVLTWLGDNGLAAINLNSVILIFWALGMILHQTPMSYAKAFSDGTRSSAGILLQFPVYFGILGAAQESGILSEMARGLTSLSQMVAPEVGAPIMTFVSAGFINLLIPSGGGQWALQKDIILETCKELSISRAFMVMAFSYGDQITNMLQPFWALPLLSITRLKARQVMGYTMVAMAVAIPLFVIPLIVFSS